MSKKKLENNMVSNFINNKKYIFVIIFTIMIYVYIRDGIVNVPVEDLDIPAGIGIHVIPKGENSVEYQIPISFYNYGEDMRISTLTHTGTAGTIAETRERRQVFSNKKLILGVERIVILSEAFSEFGIHHIIHTMFRNPLINDTGLLAVCKGNPEDVLSFQVPDYPSSSDYITSMIESSTKFNFFSDNYKFMDLYVRVDSEGRSLVLPYVELKGDKLRITGMALFKKDKMVNKISLSESKTMNMLRENKVKGVLKLQQNSKEYLTYYATTKRKVRCEKNDDKYTFFIELSLNGDIAENHLYLDIRENEETMKKFEKEMSEYAERLSYNFIDKMQTYYKVDCLELGRVAAAKYGRHKGIDWDKEVSNADIKVKVSVKVDKMGRGDY
ncbi:Ger(x)C family spore germination protein [Oceanirhabdus sp. W0125-5]|uniref:Ger(x)C family spore germination protein n=1 Tax=Oceanirhabdus sp. W0125-5 TaxID=2999116 RepID=UPI0022F2F26E|nr:Ger(x)C family spore germination protein [Oceanirhabdus sp. W0125-5]WBW98347.1 Ger(x)C family spore germination protein [Oceanirhabdus sp. W0125-5]